MSGEVGTERPAAEASAVPPPQAERPKKAKKKSIWKRMADRPIAVASIVGMLVLWQVLSMALGETTAGYRTVPSIADVISSFKNFGFHWPGGLGAEDTRGGADPTYWGAVLGLLYNGGISLLRVIVGFTAGLVAGIGLALILSYSRIVREMFLFPAHFARMLPLLAMVPLFGLWFGAAEIGTLLFIAFAIGILMFAITLNSLGNVPKYYSQYASSLGASRVRTYLTVSFPAIIPQLRAAVLIAVPFSWSAVLAAEVLGKPTGLGRILNFALYYGATDVAAVTGVVVIVVSTVSYLWTRRFLDWLTRWSV